MTQWGGNRFRGDAVPTGALDPWHVLSAGGGRSGVLIAGASHCADMAPTRPGDPPALRAARQVSGAGGTRGGGDTTPPAAHTHMGGGGAGAALLTPRYAHSASQPTWRHGWPPQPP